MVSLAKELELTPDQFAFYFRSEGGVDARDLGIFLQRAATLARRQGAELRVTALTPGSLAVIIRVLRRTARAARKELSTSPIVTSAAGAEIVRLVVHAIATAASPGHHEPSPFAKSAAHVVVEQKVQQIEIITTSDTVVIMDEQKAGRVLEAERQKDESLRVSGPEIRALIEAARDGDLSGQILEVAGELHFRPDGHRYLVPMDIRDGRVRQYVHPGMHVRLRGNVLTYRGQPEVLIVEDIDRI